MSNNLSDGARGGTMTVTKGALAIGDGAKTGVAVPTTVIHYGIDGIGYATTAAATNKPLTAGRVQAADTTCLYLIMVDSSVAFTSVQGRETLNADLVALSDVVEWPEPSANKCCIGAVKIKTVAVTFTPGTTALAASGVTATYYNIVGGVPIKPLAA